MATLNEIIYILKNEINDYSNDYKVSNRQFEFMINYLRATLIKRDVDKKKTLSSNVIQNLGPVPTSPHNITDNPNIPAGNILCTTDTIPHPIETNDKDIFTYIGGLDRRSPYEFTNRSYGLHWSAFNKYTSGLKRSYFRDSKIYVTGDNSLPVDHIWIEGVFEDPRDVYNYMLAHKDPACTVAFEEMPYPLSEYMIETMTTMIKKGELDMKFTQPRDNVNNGADASPNESIKPMMNNGYGNQGYGNQGYGNQGYGNQGYGRGGY